MAEPREHLSHLLVENRSTDEEFRRRGRGNPKIRPVEDRAAHGSGRLGELRSAVDTAEETRAEVLTEEELRALGTVVTLEGDESDYPSHSTGSNAALRTAQPRSDPNGCSSR